MAVTLHDTTTTTTTTRKPAGVQTTTGKTTGMTAAQREAFYNAHASLRNAAPHIERAYHNFVLAGVPESALTKVLFTMLRAFRNDEVGA